ncbi:MAG: hypothetical protein RLZZ435_3427, partial [Cyanobacteriota bacterium]
MSYDLILRHCKCYNPSNTDLPPQTLPIMDVGIWGQTIARIAPHLE